jgi:hypothetical protein
MADINVIDDAISFSFPYGSLQTLEFRRQKEAFLFLTDLNNHNL